MKGPAPAPIRLTRRRDEVQWAEPVHLSRREWASLRAQLVERPHQWGIVSRGRPNMSADYLRKIPSWAGFEFKTQAEPVVGAYTTEAQPKTWTLFARYIGGQS
jgi:hypothetical protein